MPKFEVEILHTQYSIAKVTVESDNKDSARELVNGIIDGDIEDTDNLLDQADYKVIDGYMSVENVE